MPRNATSSRKRSADVILKTSVIENDTLFEVKSFDPSQADEILEYYRKYQVVHVKKCVDTSSIGFEQLQALYAAEPAMVQKTFTVESKTGESGYCSLTPQDIYGGVQSYLPNGQWYTSFLVQSATDGTKKMRKSIEHFKDTLPLRDSFPFTASPLNSKPTQKKQRAASAADVHKNAKDRHISLMDSSLSKFAPLLDGSSSSSAALRYTEPIWIFLGNNNLNSSRKGQESSSSLHGRLEHVDSVDHDGTWHVQCKGTKVWYIRPADTTEWGADTIRIGTSSSSKSVSKKRYTNNNNNYDVTGKEEEELCKGDNAESRRLRVCVEEGDFFMLNTRIWWHQTRIPPAGTAGTTTAPHVAAGGADILAAKRRSNAKTSVKSDDEEHVSDRSGLCFSYARDFFAPLLRLPVRAAIMKSKEEGEGHNPSDTTVRITATATAAAAAAARTRATYSDEGKGKGERLSAAAVGQEEYTNIDGVYAAKCVQAGDVVLTEEELPDCELPRSEDPSCEVVWLEDGSGALVALKDLIVGDWLSIAPSDDESDEDNDEESEEESEEEEEE